MQDQATRAAVLTAIAQPHSPAPSFADLAAWATWNAHTIAGEARTGEAAMKPPSRVRRFGRALRQHPITTARTCVHAAKLLPTVRKALPWYVLPIVVLAAAVKMLPLDFGTDEALFAIAFALVLWRRPGLLEALYREAQSGRPAKCQCARHAR